MEQCVIPIVNNNKLNPVFIKANTFLLWQFFNEFTCSDDINNERLLETLWKQHFNAELIKDNTDKYIKIIFPTNSDRTVFLLKFGV